MLIFNWTNSIHRMLIYPMHNSTSTIEKLAVVIVVLFFFWQLMVAGVIGASGAFVQIIAYN